MRGIKKEIRASDVYDVNDTNKAVPIAEKCTPEVRQYGILKLTEGVVFGDLPEESRRELLLGSVFSGSREGHFSEHGQISSRAGDYYLSMHVKDGNAREATLIKAAG